MAVLIRASGGPVGEPCASGETFSEISAASAHQIIVAGALSGSGIGQEAKIAAVNANHIDVITRQRTRCAKHIAVAARDYRRIMLTKFRQHAGWYILAVIRGRFVYHNDTHNPDRA